MVHPRVRLSIRRVMGEKEWIIPPLDPCHLTQRSGRTKTRSVYEKALKLDMKNNGKSNLSTQVIYQK